jgi:hypothetical protein
MDSSGSGYGPLVGSCGHGNEPSGSITGEEFLVQLSHYQLFKDSVVRYCAFAGLPL